MAALLFLYGAVLGRPLDQLAVVPAAHLPTVLTRDVVRAVLAGLSGVHRLVALLQYGAGLWVMEALCVRVKDVDFATSSLLVRHGKGGRDRTVMLPAAAAPLLHDHLTARRRIHEADLRKGLGRVLPHALARKCPAADRE
jgi:site-specific recombinase XerD